jgi:hypothetical protein
MGGNGKAQMAGPATKVQYARTRATLKLSTECRQIRTLSMHAAAQVGGCNGTELACDLFIVRAHTTFSRSRGKGVMPKGNDRTAGKPDPLPQLRYQVASVYCVHPTAAHIRRNQNGRLPFPIDIQARADRRTDSLYS